MAGAFGGVGFDLQPSAQQVPLSTNYIQLRFLESVPSGYL